MARSAVPINASSAPVRMVEAGPPVNRRIVIVGGGVAGLSLATALGRQSQRGRKAHQVTLIDRDSAHVWKPMLHTVAAGTRDVSQQQTSYIAQARAAGFDYHPGDICGLDRAGQRILLAPMRAPDGRLLIEKRWFHYDALVFAVGSEANDFGTPGVDKYCFTIDSRRQAEAFNLEVRLQILQCLAQDHQLSIAIVGGGATGVELAAELVHLAETAEAYGAKNLHSKIQITLIEGGGRLLPAFPEVISSGAQRQLERLGIHVLTNVRVTAATADGFVLRDRGVLPASVRVWAAGVKAPSFLADIDGLETTRSHQLLVRPSLQTTRDPKVYALGDCASLTPEGGARPLPPTAQVADQQAQHLMRHLLVALSENVPVPAFRYRDFGALVSLANYEAYGSLGKFGLLKQATIRGALAQVSHALLYRRHQARLFGFWRGGLLWLVDQLNRRLKSSIRLD